MRHQDRCVRPLCATSTPILSGPHTGKHQRAVEVGAAEGQRDLPALAMMVEKPRSFEKFNFKIELSSYIIGQ